MNTIRVLVRVLTRAGAGSLWDILSRSSASLVGPARPSCLPTQPLSPSHLMTFDLPGPSSKVLTVPSVRPRASCPRPPSAAPQPSYHTSSVHFCLRTVCLPQLTAIFFLQLLPLLSPHHSIISNLASVSHPHPRMVQESACLPACFFGCLPTLGSAGLLGHTALVAEAHCLIPLG